VPDDGFYFSQDIEHDRQENIFKTVVTDDLLSLFLLNLSGSTQRRTDCLIFTDRLALCLPLQIYDRIEDCLRKFSYFDIEDLRSPTYYAAWIGSELPTFRDNPSDPLFFQELRCDR
jgi:hypothetical protein